MTRGFEPRYTPEELAVRLGQHAPTPEQSSVISAPLEPRLVVAGAGSGKTATMSDRVIWLVANGLVAPDEVLGVTFTRKAAGELAHRINRKIDVLLETGLEIPDVGGAGDDGGAGGHGVVSDGFDGEAASRASVSTYHSYANTLVQDHGMRIGLEPDTQMIGEAQSFQLVSRLVRAYPGELDSDQISATTLVGSVIKLAADCSEHLVEPEDVAAFLEREISRAEALPFSDKEQVGSTAKVRDLFTMLRLRTVMSRLVGDYRRAKLENGVMDFGDLVRFAAKIAQEIGIVGEIERSRYRVVLLDEFQDTSHAQLELFRGLYGNGHPVTAVGDPHQSIYGFRGASAGQLFSFPHLFPRLDRSGQEAGENQEENQGENRWEPAPVSYLTTAWRNSLNVLAAANTVSGPLRSEPVNGIEVKPLVPSPVAGDGEVRVSWYRDSVEEAEALVRDLIAVPQGRTRAVLCRNRSQFLPLMDAMDAADVPYEVLGLSGLLSVPEVADLIAVLHVISDPQRSDHLMRILTGARWRIGTTDLMALQDRALALARQRRPQTDRDPDGGDLATQDTAPEEEAESSSLIEAVDWLPEPGWTGRSGLALSDEGRSRLQKLSEELRWLSSQAGLELTALVRLVEKTIGVDIEVASRPGANGIAARRHLDAFLDAARDFSAGEFGEHSVSDLTAFLSWLEAAEEREKGLGIPGVEPRDDAVQLLTAHASKGLEWDVVAVPGMVDSVFPGGKVDTWTAKTAGHLPWDLRGDATGLPQWDREWPNQRDWAGHAVGWWLAGQADYPDSYRAQAEAHHLAEERRLAYVSFTRARDLLLVSGSHWRGITKKPGVPSPFLLEVADGAGPDGVVRGPWTEPEEAGEDNPFADRVTAAWWPFDPLDGPETFLMDSRFPHDLDRAEPLPPRTRPRRAALERSAARVHAAEPLEVRNDPVPGRDVGTMDLARQVQWVLDRSQPVNHRGEMVELPSHISASAFVEMANDPASLARQLRRPMPRPPAHAARRGTAFHSWVEDYFGRTGMLDFDDPEDSADHWVEDALDLEPMKESFLASRWAEKAPAYIEPPVETTVGGVTLRGRIDAVFREGGSAEVPNDPQARWELVDWKTGAVPSGRDLEIKSLQLAVYRLAWSRLHGIPLENISACFVYVAHGTERALYNLAGAQELEEILAAAVASPEN
ncbi:ATP-dependent helicase [Citricoccus sp. GCM10030269]|uniref:ATP-dependent helicase n=1 Tax=Citricoccus sp. GCM10030269 TaxID=3273388 RepID=UPI0036122F14